MNARAGRSAGRAGALAGVIALGLSGCGFHLEGRYVLPSSLAAVRLEAVDTQSDFYINLRQDLRAAGARIVSDRKDPSAAVINVTQDGTANTILAVSTLNVPTEYELTYTVSFSVQAAGGRQLVAPQTRTLVQAYSYSESEQLAKQREAEVLTAALARELAGVVMRQLARL
jgi:LPS-assembly lipoprotein